MVLLRFLTALFLFYVPILITIRGFPDSLVGKEFICNAGDPGLIPGSGRSTGEGIGPHSTMIWPPLWLSW